MTAEGQPMGKVFLKTTIQDGGLPSVTASHELLECSWTPGSISPSRSRPPTRPARSMPWRFAMCARPMIIRIAVSDFVTPAWFEGWRAPNSTRFDHMQRIEKPLSLLPGGCIGIMRFSGGGWTQITEAHPSGMTSQFRPHVGAQGTPALAAGLVASLDRSPGRPPLIGVVFRRPDTLLPRCCP
jgi:hypothetical protein